jgi:hypothetical protein
MDLDSILKKTQKTSDRTERKRSPIHIALHDRPYELKPPEEISKLNKTPQNISKKTGNKLGTNGVQNREQTGNKLGTNWEQGETSKNETGNKLGTELGTELGTNREQTGNKLGTNWSFCTLIGLQRSIVLFIYDECKKNRSKMTSPLTIEHISSVIGADRSTAKTTLKRLITKKCIIRREFKVGRGGWTRYELVEHIYNDLMLFETGNKLGTNWEQRGYKGGTQWGTQSGTTYPSSSSSNINLITTTTTKQSKTKPGSKIGGNKKTFALPQAWVDIDLSETEKVFGFTQNHLLQLYEPDQEQGNKVEIMKNSIDYFLFDLEVNHKEREIRTSPLTYFMGIMKKVGVYAAPSNYESRSDRAIRAYLENQAKVQEKRNAMEEELFSLHFTEWEKGLIDEEKRKVVPLEVLNGKFQAPIDASLRQHFRQAVWPALRKDLMQKANETL